MFNKYPYSDVHELNLDWVIDICRKAESQLSAISENVSDILEKWKNDGTLQQMVNDNLAVNLSEINDKITALTNNITLLSNSLASKVNKIKNVVCIGDSYLEGYTPDGTVSGWGDRLASLSGWTVHKYYKGGAGFTNTVDNINFTTLLNSAKNGVPDTSDIDLVIVAGGYNEGSGIARNDVKTWVDTARNYFPNAIIAVGYIAVHGTRSVYSVNASVSAYTQEINGCVSLGDLSGALISDMILNVSSDGIHPNGTGQSMIASAIYNAIRGNRHVTNIKSASVRSDGEGQLFFSCANNNLLFTTIKGSATELLSGVCNGITLNYKHTARSIFNNLKGDIGCEPVIPVIVYNGSNQYAYGTARIVFSGGYAEYYISALNTNGSNYFQNATGFMYIKGNHCMIPSYYL